MKTEEEIKQKISDVMFVIKTVGITAPVELGAFLRGLLWVLGEYDDEVVNE